MDNFSHKIYYDIDRIVQNIIGSQKYPFTIQVNEFKELLEVIEITLKGIYDSLEITLPQIANYLLIKYIKCRATKKIKKALRLNISPNNLSPILKNSIHPRIQELLNIPQPAQKSQAWLNQRQSYITASVFGDACGLKGPSALVTLLLNKVSYGKYRPFHGNKATQWGEKYEDICNAIYCYRNECRIFEFGMIPHPNIPFIGASTDGISDSLVNIEIKSPFSRFITGITPIGYWAQTQLQMAVLDLEITHFLECSFYEYATEEAFFTDFEWVDDEGRTDVKGNQITFKKLPPDNHHKEKGLIFEVIDLFQKNLEGNPQTIYIYSPIKYYLDKEGLLTWRKKTLENILKSKNLIFIRVIPWILTRLSCVKIERDREWFDSQVPIITEFWQDVKYYRDKNLSLEEIENLKDKLVIKYSNFRRGDSKSSSRNSSDTESTKSRSSPKSKKNIMSSSAIFDKCLLGDSDDEIENKNISKNCKKKKTSLFHGCMLDSDDELPKPKIKSKSNNVSNNFKMKSKTFNKKINYKIRNNSCPDKKSLL